MLALTDADFNRLHTYIKANYGIDLSKKKAADCQPSLEYAGIPRL